MSKLYTVAQRVGGKNIYHKSRNGAVQNALAMAVTGEDTECIVDGKFRLVGMRAIRLYAEQVGLRTGMRWVDRPETFIKKGVGYIDGVAIS
jgi:hypothetical protein